MFQVFSKRTANGSVPNPPLERQEPKTGTPKIGLALSGGAARGWAHIGVIKGLVANGLVPDVIAGTSIGALVGGAWAAGKLDELESWVRAINKRRILGLMDFRFGGAGLIAGGRLADSARQESRRHHDRKPADPLRRDRDRTRHRSRNLADARTPHRRDARELRPPRHFQSGEKSRAAG